MRIFTLLPSATEIVCALGLEEALVGVSHECDYPPAVRGKPLVVRSAVDGRGMASAEVERLIQDHLRHSQGVYVMDPEALERLRPDLIVTQQQCDV